MKSRLPHLRAWHEEGYVVYPWRRGNPGKRDPYQVWIAEVMAQQTRITTIVPYFQNWMRAFPQLQDVAAATVQDILKVWEGLGYYRRALNIHKSALLIMEEHQGQFPSSKEVLLSLPGIGRYTAGAILSLCFGQPEPAIDANVTRLFSRILNKPLVQSRKRDIDEIDLQIRSLLQSQNAFAPGALAEALMVLGSRVCRPRIPQCHVCPVAPACLTFSIEAMPTAAPRRKKQVLPVRHFVALFLEARINLLDCVLLVRNRESEMLSGLWSFPALLVPDPESLNLVAISQLIQQQLSLAVSGLQAGPLLVQMYSHFERRQNTFGAQSLPELPVDGPWAECRWVPRTAVQTLPMSVIDQKMAEAFLDKDT